MKKYILIIIAVLLIGVFFFNPWGRISIDPATGAVAQFSYIDTEINTAMETADAVVLADTFNRKWMVEDSPSCGFGEEVSVKIDGLTFCVARDTCPIVYVKEKDRYIRLSDEENETVRTILETYGFVFPCI